MLSFSSSRALSLLLRLKGVLVVAGLLVLWLAACQSPRHRLPAAEVDSSNTLSQDLLPLLRRQAQLDTFRAALQRTQLMDQLRKPWPYTVFAPTNKAFASSSTFLDTLFFGGGADSLRPLLKHHLAYGKFAPDRIGSDSLTISTLARQPITLRRVETTLQVNGHPVQRIFRTQNGVLYVIGALLSPRQPDTTNVPPPEETVKE